MEKERKSKLAESKIAEKLTTLIFYLSIIIFLIAFNFQDTKTGGWYQQNMLDLGGRQITDITFADSLVGFASTSYANGNSYILKTTNGGDNWMINLSYIYSFIRIRFINNTTGFTNAFQKIFKTTNAGIIWDTISLPGDLFGDDMFVFNNDTIWLADTETLTGGLFRTTNGGVNWQRLTDGINQPYPDKLYFYNSRIGFATNFQGGDIYKTTNSGMNWSMITQNIGFGDIVFVDSLTGYITRDSVRKTTNGGINWIAQKRPKLNAENSFYKFSLINKDTIWGVGGVIYSTFGYRGIVYKTTNGGVNWGYQLPDTTINIYLYDKIFFFNAKNGWAYIGPEGVHTLVGGNDTTFYTGINSITKIPPKNFELKQNYPNPFNNSSLIEYYLNETGWVKLKIFDIAGREMGTLVNEEQNTGGYGIPVSLQLSSGVYFYKMIYVNRKGEMQMDIKKLVVLK
jgi:photosystem II stability/assembly factor-like uncharacterized protein